MKSYVVLINCNIFIYNKSTYFRKIKVQKQDLEHLQALKDRPMSFLVSSPQTTVHSRVGPVPLGSGLSTHGKFFETTELQPVVTKCGNLVFPQGTPVTSQDSSTAATNLTSTAATNLTSTAARNLTSSAARNLPQEECEAIEEKTRGQVQSPLRSQERKHRLTASRQINE